MGIESSRQARLADGILTRDGVGMNSRSSDGVGTASGGWQRARRGIGLLGPLAHYGLSYQGTT